MADLTFILRQFWLEIVEPINFNTHSLYRQLLIGTTWTKTLYPQRNSKVSGPRYIATKSLSTRHIIAQQGSYDVTLQIQIFLWYCIFVDGMTFAIHFPRIRMLRPITQAHSCLWHPPPWHCQFKYDKVFIHAFNTTNFTRWLQDIDILSLSYIIFWGSFQHVEFTLPVGLAYISILSGRACYITSYMTNRNIFGPPKITTSNSMKVEIGPKRPKTHVNVPFCSLNLRFSKVINVYTQNICFLPA